MAENKFTNMLSATKLGDAQVIVLQGFIHQNKDDAANGDPVHKKTSNGKNYMVVRGTYMGKVAANVWGENIPAADEDGNVSLFVNVMLDDEQTALLDSARATGGETIEIFGNALAGKAQDGRLPSLWVANAQVVRLKAKKADGGATKVEKNIASVSGKGYNGAVQTMSYIRGTVKSGYNGAAPVSEGKTTTGKEYSRFTIEAMLDQHEHAVAFGAEDGKAGPSRKFVRCTTWGYANDRVRSLGLHAGDTVVLLGTTSQYVNERTTTSSDQMNVARIISRFAAPAAAAEATPATAPAPAPKAAAPSVASLPIDDFSVPDDDYDLPF